MAHTQVTPQTNESTKGMNKPDQTMAEESHSRKWTLLPEGFTQSWPVVLSEVTLKAFSFNAFFGLRFRTIPSSAKVKSVNSTPDAKSRISPVSTTTGDESSVTTPTRDESSVTTPTRDESSVTTPTRDRSPWKQWLYEKEPMLPEVIGEKESPEVISRREKVDCGQMKEYMNIEPRMRCHNHADSLFSTSSGFTNYRGVLNWLIVLAVCAMGRVALENIIKYGILIKPLEIWGMFSENPYEWRCLRLTILTLVYIIVIYWMECLLAKSQISERVGLIICSLTLACLIIVPGAIIFTTHPNPFFSSITLGIQSVVFLKLISYVQVNKWCREMIKNKKMSRKRMQSVSTANFQELTNGGNLRLSRELVIYPDNITLSDLSYFMCAPTLCYELNFPRSERIRKRFLAKRILEMICLPALIVGLIQQWIVPIVMNSRIPFKELDGGKLLERLLKLAVPNHLIWLIFFYWFFHSCLNTTAEILKFGDRVFYRDWWNAEDIRVFWQNWNIPVHRWAIRHVYKPLVVAGFSSPVASIAVFTVSAFFHEYLVSVPLRMFRLWAGMGMLVQIPLAYLCRYTDPKLGNIVVWISLVIGQPIAVLMYYHDYFMMNQ